MVADVKLGTQIGLYNKVGLRRLALVVEYQGTRYSGFQLQVHHPTVQGELERALRNLTGESIRVRGASRTDAGAHAKGQVIDFLASASFTTETFLRGMNSYLPVDIKVRGSSEASLDFHSRKDATSRVYRYTVLAGQSPSPILREFSHWIRPPLDVISMVQAAGSLVGTHDFSALAAPLVSGRSGVRRVDRWDVWSDGELVLMEVEASSFLPHQVRKTSSVLLEIGLGRLEPMALQHIINGNMDVPSRCAYLPAKGLCLMAVKYKDFPSEGTTA